LLNVFGSQGVLLLESSSAPVTLVSATGVSFWNGLHYFNVHGEIPEFHYTEFTEEYIFFKLDAS